jgi:hypothetical protein
MSKGVKSARGEVVDFDLLKIKQQIASAPKTIQVQEREAFIDNKFKRRLKRLQTDVSIMAAQSSGDMATLPDDDDSEDEVAE